MKIVLSPQVAMNLENIVRVVGHQEFSGVGFVDVIDGDVHVYDIALLNVGSYGYTEIDANDIIKMERPDKNKIRLWFHRHPVEGWSQTDVTTITQTPLGGVPEIVKWSASMVRTPTHWIGRMDNYITKTSQVVEITPNIDENLVLNARALLGDYYKSAEELTVTRYPFYPSGAGWSAGWAKSNQLSYLIDEDAEETSAKSTRNPREPDDTADMRDELSRIKYDDLDAWIDQAYTDDKEQWFDDDAHAAELAERYKKERERKNSGHRTKVWRSDTRL
jgi:hypothetical protein